MGVCGDAEAIHGVRLLRIPCAHARLVIVHFWPNLAFLAKLGYDALINIQKASEKALLHFETNFEPFRHR